MTEKNGIKEELAKKAGNIRIGNKGEESVSLAQTEGMAGMAEMGKDKDKENCSNSSGFVRLLRADEIECRVSVINEKGLSLLLFKDARVDQKILDEMFTPFGWRRTHQSIEGNLYCTVEIWDKEKQQWIAKQDVGTLNKNACAEKEKGQASDSFKRACFNWGIGRELYSAPFIWISSDKVTIKGKGRDSYTTSERFTVQSIAYNDQREIAALIIINDKGKKVFEMGKTFRQETRKRTESNAVASVHTHTSTNAATDIWRSELEKELRRTGVSMGAVLERYHIESFNQMTEEIYTKALNSLKKTASKAA